MPSDTFRPPRQTPQIKQLGVVEHAGEKQRVALDGSMEALAAQLEEFLARGGFEMTHRVRERAALYLHRPFGGCSLNFPDFPEKHWKLK